jgi:hypothetical protein
MYQDDMGQPPKKKNSFDASNLLMMAIVAGVMAFAIVKIVVPSPSLTQYKSDITRLETDLVNIRAKYALISDVPNITALNTGIATVEAGVNEAQKALTDAKAILETKIVELQGKIGSIPKFDPTALQASIDQQKTQIVTLAAELAALKTQVDSIQPTDLSALNTKVAAIEASVITIKADIVAIKTSIDNIKFPGIYIESLTIGFGGVQATVSANTSAYVLLTVRYTLVTPVAPTAPPALVVMPFGTSVGSSVSYTWDGLEKEIVWYIRTVVNTGDTNIIWQPPLGLTAGIWSVSVGVSV